MTAQCNITNVDRYRLAPLRDVRDLDERAKRSELAAAVGDARVTEADVAAAAKRVTGARATVDEARNAYMSLVASGASPALLALADRYLTRLRRDLAAARDAEARARAAHAGRLDVLAGARDRLASARADKELVERHFARWREQQRKLADRRAE